MPMCDAEKIRGKVAALLNSREVAINRGSEDGVVKGMKFAVLDPATQDIRDPDSGSSIGAVFRPKVILKVAMVESGVSVLHTFRSHKINRGGADLFGLNFRRMFEPSEWVTEHESLRESPHSWEALTEEESFVKVGDPVVEYEDPAEAETELED